MNGPKFDNPNIPIIGQRQQPKIRTIQVPITNLVLDDADGQAELMPLEDLSPVEVYKLMLFMTWVLSCPPMPVPDPETQGRSALVRHLQWRQFIKDEDLERHFEFRLRPDQETKGSA